MKLLGYSSIVVVAGGLLGLGPGSWVLNAPDLVAGPEFEAAGSAHALPSLDPRLAASAPETARKPVRIGLQAGHWKADEAPRELRGLKRNGTSYRGTAEWEINLAIANAAAAMLETWGYDVDVLPAVVPPSYEADLFIAIHADGSNDSRATGYRVASSRRDRTGRASSFAALLGDRYGAATNLRHLPSTTGRMRNYYAFNSRRYRHAIHPNTAGVIIETGFMTSAKDRRILFEDPGVAAKGIVDAIMAFPHTAPPNASARGDDSAG